jgi:hypothetical protein
LITANYNTNNVSVLLGIGSGGFNAATSFASGTNSQSVTAADFNADGKLDLAVANFTINKVSILLNTGTGSFGTPTSYTTGTYPFGVVSADFNADGFQDVATGNFNSNNVSVLLGNGTGSFATSVGFSEGSSVYCIITADLNNDGKTDIATSIHGYAATLLNCTTLGITSFENENTTTIYPNPSNGSFTIETSAGDKKMLQIYDIPSRLVLTQSIKGKTTIDASNLPSGVYNVSIISNEGIVNKRAVIAR